MIHLSFVVIYVTDVERARMFYEKLGLRFVAEKHGSGQPHYACNLNGTILELYPRSSKAGGTRFGLRLPAAAAIAEELKVFGFRVEPTSRGTHRVQDPDGNTIELAST